MKTPFFKVKVGEGPFIVTAIHNGHYIDDEIAPYLALNDKERFYEEDPYTGFFAEISPTVVKALHSRFEVDLNRVKTEAIYQRPEQSWGLKVWKQVPPADVLAKSERYYDEFYRMMRNLINAKIDQYGFALILDLHSYNYNRSGSEQAKEADNPDINVGTRGMDRRFWAPVVDAFIETLRMFQPGGRPLNVQENLKFKGGFFPTSINQYFNHKACALAIEVKKIFMDEHTNVAYPKTLNFLRNALSEAGMSALNAAFRIIETQKAMV